MADIAQSSDVSPLIGAVVKAVNAGGNVRVGNCAYIVSDGDWEEADANVSAITSAGLGIIVATHDGELTAVDGDGISVVVLGPVTGFSGLTPGQRVFVSINVGRIADAAPSGAGTWTQCLGYVLDAQTIFVLPGLAAPTSNS